MPNSIRVPILTTYTPIDTNKIKEAYAKLDDKILKAKAVEDAENAIPEGYDHIPSESHTEYAIENAFKQTEKDFLNDLTGAVENFNRDTEKNYRIEEANEISEEDLKLKIDSEYRSIAIIDEEANSIAKDYLNSSIDLRKFRSRHERETTANYPNHKIWPIAILVVLFLIESTINGIVFKDLSGGFIGGILVASGFSAMNVLLAFITGHFGWRNLIFNDIVNSTREYLRKFLGFTVTIIGMSLGLLWNLAVAHYREVATNNNAEDLLNTGQVAFKHLIANPFGITELEALALLIFGIIIFILVAKDFYNGMDDPFPGYGAITRKQEEAEANWLELKKFTEDQIVEIGDELKKEYQDKIDENRTILNDAKANFDLLKRYKDDVLSSLTDSLKIANTKLAIFRDEYTTIVGENGRRKHFDFELSIDNTFHNIYSEKKSENKIKALKNIVKKNIAIYEKAIKYIDILIPTYIEKLHKRIKDGDSEDGYFEKLLKNNDKNFIMDGENEQKA